MENIKFKKLTSKATIPTKATPGSVALDVSTTGEFFFGTGDYTDSVVYWKTGLSVQPPEGYYFELHARSSLHKKGWKLANSVGIIDADYRGELILAMHPYDRETNKHHGYSIFDDAEKLTHGTRVAQLILRKNYLPDFEVVEVDNLTETDRGNGGFGSTGTKV